MPKQSAQSGPKQSGPKQSGPATAQRIVPGDDVPADVRELFEKRRKYLNAGRANYGKADKLLEQILQRCAPGVSVTLDPATKKGKPETHTLVDVFADKNQVWVGRAAKRFDIDVKTVKAQDLRPVGEGPETD
jgi:hypothetical protein